ncbi:MAG: Cache 3/Cache 2 fusion domain-containing protein [Bacteroidota bacterium]
MAETEYRKQQLLRGLEEALRLHHQTITELVQTGQWTSEQAAQHLARYERRLRAVGAPVSTANAPLTVNLTQGQPSLADHGPTAQDNVLTYLYAKRERAMQQLTAAIAVARSAWQAREDLTINPTEYLHMEVVNQLTRQRSDLRLPCWYWGRQAVHYDTQFVDDIEQKTQCRATIFQRTPQGFVRIATNIRGLDQRRAVGTYIPHHSKVAQTVLTGATYRGSAFVLNNWYLSIYEPIFHAGEVRGILYVGRQEALELIPPRALATGSGERLFEQLHQSGALEVGLDAKMTEKLVAFLDNLPERSAHPLLQIGLKEVSALLMQQQERQQSAPSVTSEEHVLDRIVTYIRQHLSEDISVAQLAELSCMSTASFYRYFKARYNTTPNAFLNRERLRQAYELMQTTPARSVRAVCQEVGFRSTSYFIKLFRQQYGTTPKQWQLERETTTTN